MDSFTFATFYRLLEDMVRGTQISDLTLRMRQLSRELSSFPQLPQPRQREIRNTCLRLANYILENYIISKTSALNRPPYQELAIV